MGVVWARTYKEEVARRQQLEETVSKLASGKGSMRTTSDRAPSLRTWSRKSREDTDDTIESVRRATAEAEALRLQIAAAETVSVKIRENAAAEIARRAAAEETTNRIREEAELETSRLQNTIEQLKAAATKDRNAYNELRNFIAQEDLHYRGMEKKALIGPKGSGKSTLLWMFGWAEKPAKTLGDGTITLTDCGSFVDTVGVNFEVVPLARLMAIFIRNGFPSSLIVSNGNDRIERVNMVLKHMGVMQFYYFDVDLKRVYRENRGTTSSLRPEYFDGETKNMVDQLQAGIHVIDSSYTEQRFEPTYPFHEFMGELFSGGRICLPTWDEFTDSPDVTINSLRHLICKEYREYKQLDFDDRAFLARK
jgi:energy-coupling factor transporter ATP-binding protein EcfA2